MPNHEEHCQHTLKRYGVRGDDIHTFLDEPCRVAGQGHREFRHDTKTVKLVGELFGPKYGKELAENIALDHITADHEEDIREHRDSIVLLECPNCGAPLGEIQNGKRACKYCGFETKVSEFTSDTPDSVRLTSKSRCLLLYRKSRDETLPIALPPLVIKGYEQRGSKDTIIDEVYSEFEDKAEVELLLEQALDYHPVTIADLRSDYCGYKTDRQIKDLVLESKKVTNQHIRKLLQRSEVKSFKEDYERMLQEQAAQQRHVRQIRNTMILAVSFLFAIAGFLLGGAFMGLMGFLFILFVAGGVLFLQSLDVRSRLWAQQQRRVRMLHELKRNAHKSKNHES